MYRINIFVDSGSSGGMSSEGDDAMRLAFEQYMMGMGGNSNSQPVKEKVEVDPEKEERERRSKLEQQRQNEMKKAEKFYWQIYQKFRRRLEEEWLDIDDQAYQVVQAIGGIRNRLPMHAKLLEQCKCTDDDGTGKNVGKDHWSLHSYNNHFVSGNSLPEWKRSRNGGGAIRYISGNDVKLAISHDLIQHEKMLSALRGLFASLSECHETMLRHLNEMTQYHLECMEDFAPMGFEGGSCTFSSSFEKAVCLVSVMTEIVTMLSQEMYRKQCMVHTILQTAQDDLLKTSGNNGKDIDAEWDDLSPKDVVDRCCKAWPRQSKSSCIDSRAITFALDNE